MEQRINFTISGIFIIGAPMFFSTVWGWIKRWFDPITVSKIFILSHNEVLPTLQKFVNIKNIPTIYGGELTFDWGQRPNLDPAIRDRVTWENGFDDFPPGPLYWRPIEDDRIECVAVGSVEGKDRLKRVCTMPKQLRAQEAGSSVADAETRSVSPETVKMNGAAEATATAASVPLAEQAITTISVENAGSEPKTEQRGANELRKSEADETSVSGVQGVQNLALVDNVGSQKDTPETEAEKTDIKEAIPTAQTVAP